MTDLKPKKIGENEYQIDADSSLGMKVPVTIYADETLLQKMMTDRTLKQAINVSTLPGIQEHAVVLPDGHEGYGFPVGGVAAMDAEEGMISPVVLVMTLIVVLGYYEQISLKNKYVQNLGN